VSYHYFIAGLCIRTPVQLPDLPSVGNADANLDVILGDCPSITSELKESNQWIALPRHIPEDMWCNLNGKELCVFSEKVAPNLGVAIRQSIPFASALQGRVILHASAIEYLNTGVVFVGPSGVGKSTIGKFFSDQGYRLLSDDLLPCRLSLNGQPQIFSTLDEDVDDRLVGFSSLHFLKRDKDFSTVHCVQLDETKAMQRLIRHGFGEVENKNIWRVQFDMYRRLATSVPAFDMHIPENDGMISAIMQHIENLLVNGI